MENNELEAVKIESWIEEITTCVFNGGRFRKSQGLESILRWNLPYGILRSRVEGQHVIVNREYKPMGFAGREHHTIYGLPIKVDGSYDNFYFYNDGTRPWSSQRDYDNYMIKLKKFVEHLRGEAS